MRRRRLFGGYPSNAEPVAELPRVPAGPGGRRPGPIFEAPGDDSLYRAATELLDVWDNDPPSPGKTLAIRFAVGELRDATKRHTRSRHPSNEGPHAL